MTRRPSSSAAAGHCSQQHGHQRVKTDAPLFAEITGCRTGTQLLDPAQRFSGIVETAAREELPGLLPIQALQPQLHESVALHRLVAGRQGEYLLEVRLDLAPVAFQCRQQGQHLNRLAQSHVVGQARSQSQLG